MKVCKKLHDSGSSKKKMDSSWHKWGVQIFAFNPFETQYILYSNWIICTIILSKNHLEKPPANALLGTNNQHFLKMIFLFPRWEILVPWRVYNGPTLYLLTFLRAPPTASTVGSAKSSYVGEAWSIPDILPIPSLPVPYIFTVEWIVTWYIFACLGATFSKENWKIREC